MITTLFEDFQGPVVWFDLMPWLIPIVPNFVRKWMGIDTIEKNVHKVLELMGVRNRSFSWFNWSTKIRWWVVAIT